MKKDDRLYGLEGDEELETSVDAVISHVIDKACDKPDEPMDVVLGRIQFPLRILVYRRMDIEGEAQARSIADYALDDAIGNLDEWYGDPDGGPTEPTRAMREAALAFGRAVVADYVPWACEPTGEVIEVTREEVEKHWKENE